MSLLGYRENAHYSDVVFPEYKGNPLIEALPKKLSQAALLDSLKVYPDLPTEFRYKGDDIDREEFVLTIDSFRQPLEIYYEVFRALERAIKQGYSSKNPFSPTTQHYQHYPVDKECAVLPKTGRFVSKARGITLIGESGTGKTTMLEQVLLHFPQVIEHSNYKGQEIGFKEQIVWVKVECPDKSSVRELCLEILYSLDEAMGIPETKPESNINYLMIQIEQRIKYSHLGLLVIDEMQNICVKRTQGESGLLKFIKKIVNRLGVPIVFCANPPFDTTMIQVPQNARRGENGGAFYMSRLEQNSISWKVFISRLWQLQWTNVDTPLTDELESKLYELTVGNIDFACRTYMEAQRLVIGTGDESICETVLHDAYERACIFSSRSADVLQAKEFPTNEDYIKTHLTTTSTAMKQRPFIPSVDRPQHPEFYDMLQKVFNSTTLREDIHDPDKVQQAEDVKCSIIYLRDKKLLCEDPLNETFFR